AKAYNGMLHRSEPFWLYEMPYKKKGYIAIYLNEQNIKRGYIIYTIEGNVLQVSEFIALDREAYDGLWTFIGQHDSMVESVMWYSSFEDQQFSEFNDPRIKREIEQYGMVRVVDCVSFFETYKFKPLDQA